MINARYYGTSQYKAFMKYMGYIVAVQQRIKNLCQMIDFACPNDGRVDTK